MKCFASNGPIADHFVIFAWTDKTQKPGSGISAFFVEKERGVEIGTIENKLGLKMSKTSEVILNDVRVPADHLCGELGTGYKQFLSGMDEVRITGMIFSLGIAQAAVDAAVEYAKTRKTMGQPISVIRDLVSCWQKCRQEQMRPELFYIRVHVVWMKGCHWEQLVLLQRTL